MSLLSHIDAIYVINLPHRTDRKSEMETQLRRVELSFEHPNVHLFEAVRPPAAEGFPSVGAHGCFMSHLGVLKHAAQHSFGTILILEDDADFTQRLLRAEDDFWTLFGAQDWGIFYFGYGTNTPLRATPTDHSAIMQVDPDCGVRLTHAMCLRAQAISQIIPYFEAMLARPSGDPQGGPMHVDGAYSWWRKGHSDQMTLATRDQWVVQRASDTDIDDGASRPASPLRKLLRPLLSAWRRR